MASANLAIPFLSSVTKNRPAPSLRKISISSSESSSSLSSSSSFVPGIGIVGRSNARSLPLAFNGFFPFSFKPIFCFFRTLPYCYLCKRIKVNSAYAHICYGRGSLEHHEVVQNYKIKFRLGSITLQFRSRGVFPPLPSASQCRRL